MKYKKEHRAFRALYIKALKDKVFPWEAAYYFYCETSDNIDIYPFEDFVESILQKSQQYVDPAEAYRQVSAPIYDELEHFYSLNTLFDRNYVPIMIY